ncbi:sensor histidine kinase [Massilia aurea]|uniref:sensor histidine kinase n=1 Tax=Massilia aurea TaxID=373040 RepID=UPI000F2DDDC8|nr:sensor histidine kinase [Massilia aurea]
MTNHRLSEFIHSDMERILQTWEDFARTIEPPALTMDDVELRDHARQMLQAIADDLATTQSDAERTAKSQGLGKRERADTAAETHAEARLLSGYTVVQLVSEYRALRSSVLTLWIADERKEYATDVADITRFNEAIDQALAESVARYESMVKRSQNMFLAILGHDLRNPLGTVVTGSQLIMAAVDIPPKYILAATRMYNSAKRMSKLVSDLIDFTRTHLGPGIPIHVRQGDLVKVCEDVANELRTSQPEMQIDFLAPNSIEAIFDGARIGQMLSNLAGNAIQYGNADMPITIKLQRSDDDVVITVNNHGDPIDADELARIFDPLVRIAAESGTGECTSLGIGLFISREIVHAHAGHIEVSSSAQEGTTFTVTMPRLPAGFSSPATGRNRAGERASW